VQSTQLILPENTALGRVTRTDVQKVFDRQISGDRIDRKKRNRDTELGSFRLLYQIVCTEPLRAWINPKEFSF
jgi:hypothetical protein